MKQNRTLSFGMSQLISEEEIEKVSAGQANLTFHMSNNANESGRDYILD